LPEEIKRKHCAKPSTAAARPCPEVYRHAPPIQRGPIFRRAKSRADIRPKVHLSLVQFELSHFRGWFRVYLGLGFVWGLLKVWGCYLGLFQGILKLFMVDLGLVWELFRVGEDANYGEDV